MTFYCVNCGLVELDIHGNCSCCGRPDCVPNPQDRGLRPERVPTVEEAIAEGLRELLTCL